MSGSRHRCSVNRLGKRGIDLYNDSFRFERVRECKCELLWAYDTDRMLYLADFAGGCLHLVFHAIQGACRVNGVNRYVHRVHSVIGSSIANKMMIQMLLEPKVAFVRGRFLRLLLHVENE